LEPPERPNELTRLRECFEVNYLISHVLVPVDPHDDTQAAQLAALQLAQGAGALVTLLYVHNPLARIETSNDIDAIRNLHAVMSAAPEDGLPVPVYSDNGRQESIGSLSHLRAWLAAIAPEGLQVRVVCRCGDALDETLSFIEEAGVDVVLIQSPADCKSPSLRRLARSLQQHCSCQLQIVHPPRRGAPASSFALLWRGWWRSIKSRLRTSGRARSPFSRPLPASDSAASSD
jgi:hypothetical protein